MSKAVFHMRDGLVFEVDNFEGNKDEVMFYNPIRIKPTKKNGSTVFVNHNHILWIEIKQGGRNEH